MPEKLLDRSDIVAAYQQMRRERMAAPLRVISGRSQPMRRMTAYFRY